MSLDTVELVYSFERYFRLELPDPVAETIFTVGNAAAYFSEQLGVAGRRDSAAREAVRQQLSELLELPLGAFEAASATTLRQALPDAQAVARFRQLAERRYGLATPALQPPPTQPATPSLFEKLLGIPPRPSLVPWPAQPLAALLDWVVAANYEKLLPVPPASAYEVERAVVGITSEKSGVEVAEITLNSSFTDDLGMD